MHIIQAMPGKLDANRKSPPTNYPESTKKPLTSKKRREEGLSSHVAEGVRTTLAEALERVRPLLRIVYRRKSEGPGTKLHNRSKKWKQIWRSEDHHTVKGTRISGETLCRRERYIRGP